MTIQQKNDLFYLTQYANNMTDDQFFNRITYMIERYDLDIDFIVEIAELMTATSDKINEKLFYEMLEATSNADLEVITYILMAIDNDDLYELDKWVDNNIDRFMYENNIHDEDYFYMIADMELKENGIDANCLSWVNNIPHNFDFAELDCYYNFTTMTTSEVIERFFDEWY